MDDKEFPLLKDMDTPYYIQVYDIICQMIQNGQLDEGDILPGENVMAEYWNVSRSTVRMAMRRLAEEGYIYKMQGKKTTVTGQMARRSDGLQHIFNPCINSCIKTISKIETSVSIQNGSRKIGELLGYNDRVFTTATVKISYFVEDQCVAFSFAVIPLRYLEQKGISIDNKEKLEELAVKDLYSEAERASLSMSVLDMTEGEELPLQARTMIVMDEVFYREGNPLAYHKYRMDCDWYRFVMERKS